MVSNREKKDHATGSPREYLLAKDLASFGFLTKSLG